MAVILDLIEGPRYREIQGVVQEITRTAIVTDLPAAVGVDSMLREALDEATLPQPGAVHPVEEDLILQDRVPSALDIGVASVELIYRLPAGGSFPPAPGFAFTMRGGSAVEQVETAVNRFGAQINVTYGDHTIGGKIHPLVAAEQLTLGEQIKSADPTIIHRTWTNAVNIGTFFFDVAALPRTWLITDIGYDLVNAASQPFPTWDMTYELRKRPLIIAGVIGTWDPQVVYESDDGTIPKDLIAGTGYKTVEWHYPMDFAQLFGA